jgi:hypothetical protein
MFLFMSLITFLLTKHSVIVLGSCRTACTKTTMTDNFCATFELKLANNLNMVIKSISEVQTHGLVTDVHYLRPTDLAITTY